MSGITHFDLPGDFGRYDWLGNFYIIFLYNMLFAGLTSACLVKALTRAMQPELICAVGEHRFMCTELSVHFIVKGAGLCYITPQQLALRWETYYHNTGAHEVNILIEICHMFWCCSHTSMSWVSLWCTSSYCFFTPISLLLRATQATFDNVSS